LLGSKTDPGDRSLDDLGDRLADIEDFAEEYDGDVEFVRVAVTPAQARLHNLPSAPPKATDNRRFAVERAQNRSNGGRMVGA
jgi:hypothetical protein